MGWVAIDDDDDDTDAGAEAVEDTLDAEGALLFRVALAYFPPHVNVSHRWTADLVRRRRCTQCGTRYRDLDNFALACPRGTHVLPIDTRRSYDARAGDFRGVWRCCGRPADDRTAGCVRADHTDGPVMRRLRHESTFYSVLPACLWFSIPRRDNLSVLMSEDTSAPTDADVEAEYAHVPAPAPGSVPTVTLLRFDWRESRRRRILHAGGHHAGGQPPAPPR